jgi:hypothetical protein
MPGAFEDRPGLCVDATNVNSLLHAFQSHSEQEKPCYLQVYWHVNKYFPKCSDIAFIAEAVTTAFRTDLR